MKHKKMFCKTCNQWTVICGACGNPACNGGVGTVHGKPCEDCETAYKIFVSGDKEIKKLSLKKT